MENFNEIENKYSKLIKKATDIMKEVPDPKHSVSHMESIVKYTKEILSAEINADREVCILSAYWHDVGRIKGEKGHALLSAEMLKQELLNENYDKDFIEKCYLAIYKHGWSEHPETIEGKIIRDADKIDFVGISRWKSCIDNNCKFNKILDMLPTLRKDIFEFEISKEIFDREIGLLIRYLHDIIFNDIAKSNCYSYVMGMSDEIYELEKYSFIIEKDNNDFRVTFSKELSSKWEEFVTNHLEVEYWNEYISNNEITFLFHLKDGFKKYVVKNYDNDEVLKLCEKLCNCKFEFIEKMIKDNEFYKDKIN